MIGLIVAAALLQPAMPEPDWRLVGRNEAGEAHVDPASLRRDGNSFEIDERIVFTRTLPNRVRIGISRLWFDCPRRLVALRHVISFDESGTLLEDRPGRGPPSQPHPVNDGSVYSTIMDLYCPHPAPIS